MTSLSRTRRTKGPPLKALALLVVWPLLNGSVLAQSATPPKSAPPAAAPRGTPPASVLRGDARAQWRQVIEAQLDAFAADDGIAAFSFASPGIRRQFGTPENFLTMVRQAYPVVYRPSSVTFLAPKESSGLFYQPVRLIDLDSRPWLAIYRMQRQADGTWRIDGCELRAQEGTST